MGRIFFVRTVFGPGIQENDIQFIRCQTVIAREDLTDAGSLVRVLAGGGGRWSSARVYERETK